MRRVLQACKLASLQLIGAQAISVLLALLSERTLKLREECWNDESNRMTTAIIQSTSGFIYDREKHIRTTRRTDVRSSNCTKFAMNNVDHVSPARTEP